MKIAKISTIPFQTLRNQWLSSRDPHAYKGDFGHVLVVGGDWGMGGAVRMAGEAAARVGAGLVTVVTRKAHVTLVSGTRPELMCYGVEERADLLETLLNRVTVVVIGPGLGKSSWSMNLFQEVMKKNLPFVVDADGLTILAKFPQQRNNWILTPHVGEASSLLQWDKKSILDNRVSAVIALQERYGGVALLKGPGTLVCGLKKEVTRCHYGNPGMATGGMGDILSGILGGLVAQGIPLEVAAQLGVCVHGFAGDKVAQTIGERGMLASDLLALLPRLVSGKTLWQ